MLKHMVFSQKNAARKKKCMHTAETKETMVLLVIAQSLILQTYKPAQGSRACSILRIF
jgi:hypothetical protein